MESIDTPQHLAPHTSFYWIQDSELRERRLHVPTHTGSEDESVDLEKSKDPRVYHSTIIKHDVDSPLSEHSSHDQQDQQHAIEGHNQQGSRHSSGFGSGSKRCPGSFDAAPPCFSSSDEELAQLAVGSNELPYPPHQQADKVEPFSSSRLFLFIFHQFCSLSFSISFLSFSLSLFLSFFLSLCWFSPA